MSYSYETRDSGIYLLTGKKAKEKDIVIKMGSNIADIHLTDALSRTTYNLSWTIEADSLEDISTINLKGKIDEAEYLIPMETEKVVEELSNMVIKNQTLEVCNTLNNALEEGFNNIFQHMLSTKSILLCSNSPINAYIILRHKGKIIGGATRFSLNSSGMLSIYEYVGKDINRDMELTADVIVGNHRINFNLILQSNAEYEVYDTNTHTLGYFTYNARIKNILDNEGYDYIEVPEIIRLNVPNLFTSANEMNTYIRMYNSLEAIDKYRISLKPKVEIININNFMLREFTV